MILVNGISGTEVSVFDRGLAYGDGLFETIAVVGGDVLNWQRHMNRLAKGCRQLAIDVPDSARLYEETQMVAEGFERSVVKLVVTRGDGGLGYTPPTAASATRIVARRPWPEGYPERERSGIRVCVARHRLSSNAPLAGLKHLNRLDQVLASMEIPASGAVEALMLDRDARVIEGTRCNLFAVYPGRLVTPRLDQCGVRGVMRDVILELAPTVGLRGEETELTLGDLQSANEIFLSNAIAGIWPVIGLDADPQRSVPIGAHTRRLQEALVAGGHRR